MGRKIRLGKMDIRLLAAGLGPGAAQLEVGLGDQRILYCGCIRLSAPLLGPEAEVARGDILLLDAVAAEPRPPAPRRTSSLLASWVTERLRVGKIVALACGSRTAALEAAWTLRAMETPVRAVRPLYEMLRRIAPISFAVSGLVRLEKEWPGQGVVLHYSHLWPGPGKTPDRRTAVAYVGPGRQKPAWAEQNFRLGEGVDRSGLVKYVKGTGVGQVALGPNCDELLGPMLEKAGLEVHRVRHPTQMPLSLLSGRG
jgi:hypothetical protein